MKSIRIASILVVSSLSLSALAADISGKWKGKMVMDMSAIEKQMAASSAKMKPEQKKMMEERMAMAKNMIASMVLSLEINKNGTYSMVSPSAPGAKGGNTEKGKWTLSGNTITVTGDKTGMGPKVLTGIVSPNGKTITFDISKVAKDQANKQGAPKDIKTPKMTMVFTKS